MIKILVESTGITPSHHTFNNCFSDVGEEWFAPYVCYAQWAGWIEGYADGTFKPAQTVNKAESLELYEIAVKCLIRAETLEPENLDVIKLLGHIHYKLGNFSKCVKINKRAIKINPEDAYIQNGLGISLAKTGQVEEGIRALRQAIKLTDENFMDPYHDLAVILLENNRTKEAVEILDQGCKRFVAFQQMAKDLYPICP